MTPAGPGRHCAACQKTVVDFTHKTDAEILAALRLMAGQTCGRLRADQLGRPLVAPATAPRWRAWLGAVLALGGLFGAGRAAAQGQQPNYYAGPRPAASTTDHAAPAKPGRQATAALAEPAATGPATLRGTVTDSTSHEGLPGVTVLLKGTDTGASTDASGAFSLPVAAGAAPARLVFNSIGYLSEERTVSPGQPVSMALAADTHMLGEMGIVVVGGIDYKRPWPWHPRRFFNRSKHWVTKPFRG